MENKLVFLISKNSISLLQPNSYQFLFEGHEIVDGNICNMTAVVVCLSTYLKLHNLAQYPAKVLFATSLANHALISVGEPRQAEDFYVRISLGKGQGYIGSINPSMLMQYQILFQLLGIYVEEFTCESVLKINHLLQNDCQALNGVTSIGELLALIKL